MNTHQDPYLFDDEAGNRRYGGRRSDSPSDRHDQKRWDEGNYFHTGPSEHGSRQYQQQHHIYPSQNVHQHYGHRPDSAYRQTESRINFGERNQPYQQTTYDRYRSPYNSPSRDFTSHEDFKADDYRYGSGRYNWNQMSTHHHSASDPDYEEYNRRRHHGFFGRITDTVRDAWDTVTHRPEEDDDYTYRNRSGYTENRSSYNRPHESDDRFRRGYESGPRWADEHRPHPSQTARNRWPEDHNPNRRGQHQGYNPDPNNNW